ncbi:MAG: GNAT family N-acetyltransferase [Anaerolineae bacterium]
MTTDELVPARGLAAAQLEQIAELAEACNRAEGLAMKLNWGRLRHRPADELNDFLYYADGQLAGYLALYIFHSREAEVSAMVAPAARRQGIFTRLLTQARREVWRRGIPSLLFICERKSAGGQAAMRAAGAAYEFTEYRMDMPPQTAPPPIPASPVKLVPAGLNDIPTLAAMDETCFNVPAEASAGQMQADAARKSPKNAWLARLNGETIGKIHVSPHPAETFITGLCILPAYRGQGHGSAILARMLADLRAQGHRHLALEVESKNDRALNIYRRCGFEVTTAYDYFRLAAGN